MARVVVTGCTTGLGLAAVPAFGELPIRLAFDSTGRWLVGATGAGGIWVLELAAVVAGGPLAEAIVFDLVAHEGAIRDAAINTVGTLATTDFGETVRLWNVSTGEQLVELRTGAGPGLSTVDFSPTGATCSTATTVSCAAASSTPTPTCWST